METPPATALDADTARTVLVRLGLCGPDEPLDCMPLAGGVSSDIVRVDLPGRSLCLKRALPRLKVAADWVVPVERSAHEAEWLKVAAAVRPGVAPRLLGYDAVSNALAMDWLDPVYHPVWKAELRDGRVDPAFAARVGAAIGAIHATTAGDAAVAARFDTTPLFVALRLEPYLLATAARHPSLAPRLRALVESTAATRVALVHGDLSPKNLLVGPDGPVILDAECAWYGDPAFDAAFCLNHLLLKAAWVPTARGPLRAAFDAFADAWLDAARFEPRAELAGRAAALLPALMLARVDGKSPVEYLTDERDRARVRMVATRLLLDPPDAPAAVAEAWHAALAAR
jgi:aminoglycoside phosphotransferase (APT) family kinase protein